MNQLLDLALQTETDEWSEKPTDKEKFIGHSHFLLALNKKQKKNIFPNMVLPT